MWFLNFLQRDGAVHGSFSRACEYGEGGWWAHCTAHCSSQWSLGHGPTTCFYGMLNTVYYTYCCTVCSLKCNNWRGIPRRHVTSSLSLHHRPLATWMQKTIWSSWLLCAWLLNENILELWRSWWDLGLMWTWHVLMAIHHCTLWQQTRIWRSQHLRHNSCRG